MTQERGTKTSDGGPENIAAEPVKTIVTERADAIDHNTTGVTPGDTPNVAVQPMHWYQIVAVRAARVYLQSMFGLMTAGGIGLDAGLLPNDLASLLGRCAQLALAPAVFSVLQNTLELIIRLDESNPKLRA